MDVVIGAGPAGRTYAMILAEAGHEVLLLDRNGKEGTGGKCLNEACVVLGALIEAARLVVWAKLGIPGVELDVGDINFRRLTRSVRKVVETIRQRLIKETERAGVEILRAEAVKVDESLNVYTKDGDVLEADRVLIATGSRPAIPEVEGVDSDAVFTFREILEMEVPSELCVVGGGPTALESAFAFAALGSEVVLAYRSRILPNAPEEVRREILKDLELVGVNAVRAGELRAIRETSSGVECRFERGATVADAVLLATGLEPNSDIAANSGLPLRKDGSVVVDDGMRTPRDGVYAAGDVTGPPYLTPVARYEGTVAALNALGKNVRRGNPPAPRVIRLFRDFGRLELRGIDWEGSLPTPVGGPAFWMLHHGIKGKMVCRKRGVTTEAFIVAPRIAPMLPYPRCVEPDWRLIEVHPTPDPVIGLLKQLGLRRTLGE
ncbi:FAD-dependent oxidoreductase [Methanopyrus kandleri]|uniref:Dihydrolipoamide dehydrogenase n=2 Tax=Methanopyrus kandleri TaxID=2320 RepID=Q8TX29_METKA|nr:NAD(P)/FAD-dependent oxidoreductase [Methanopyrus kandleri]AAM02062.1 Dihydrolipoamide dehydrogenase [Methanopyrus kandleri AV19]HII69923.1 NAD(P)/FAD-dependent oxidoreductase [Methanopyrus kandleri]